MLRPSANTATTTTIGSGTKKKSFVAPSTVFKQRRKRRRTQPLVILYIVAFIFLSILTIYVVVTARTHPDAISDEKGLRGSLKQFGSGPWISDETQEFNHGNIIRTSNINHLIIVAGHSVLISGNLQHADIDESAWFLYDYMKGKGLPQSITAHIRAGIAEADRDPRSLLIFSGGETRALTGPVNEGSSYYTVADALKLWGRGSTVRARTMTEEFATDSFQNLMFSICRFKEITNNYPSLVTVVSFSFKRHRFETLHAPALRLPSFRFIGVDPPADTGFNYREAAEGEATNAALPFETDIYGCYEDVLRNKREGRNPFMRMAPYELSCPEIKGLLKWCGPGLYPDDLPWDERKKE